MLWENYTGGYKNVIQLLKRKAKRDVIHIPIKAKLIISVGELSVRKNHSIVIEALNRINDKNIYYIIVGQGALLNALLNKDQTGRLKLLGYRTDIVDLLHCADLFAFPSLQEGLPVALMEAMASGIPCLASKIRGNIDLLEVIPSTLVEVNTDVGWKKAIVSSFKNDQQTVSELEGKVITGYS